MLPIAICDDEPMHRQRTAAVLQEKIAGYAPALRLFASSAELLNAVETEGYAPRIAVLDIQMQEMDGISLARELNRRLPQCAVIFLTAFLSLATEVYEAKHVYFIVKSQLEARIERAVELALKQAEEDPLLLYRCGTVQRAVASREVLVSGAGSAPHQSQSGAVRGLGAGGPGDAAAGAAPGAVRPVSSELLGQSAPYHGHGTHGVRPLGWDPNPHQPDIPGPSAGAGVPFLDTGAAGKFLGQHRTIWQEHSAKDFASYESYKRAGILYVFPPFITARMGQKIGRRPQTQLCGAALGF